MRSLLALMLVIVAAGCGKNNSGGDAGVGAQASGGVSIDCLYNTSLCSGNNSVYNDYRYSGFMSYPGTINVQPYGQPYGQAYGQQYYQGNQPRYMGPIHGQNKFNNYYGSGYGYGGGFSAGISVGYGAGYGTGYGTNYNGGYYGGGYPGQQIPVQQYPGGYGNGYPNQGGTIAAGGIPSMCACPANFRPVYNGTYGLGCIAQYQMYQYQNSAYYYGAESNTNSQWVNWPQYSNRVGGTSYPGSNGCYNNVAWSCMIDAPSTCPAATRCVLVGNSNRMGICIR